MESNMTARGFLIASLSMLTQVCLCGCDAVLQVSGYVVDSQKASVEGAEVAISPGADSDVRMPPYRCKSDDTGRFAMSVTYSPLAKKPVFKVEVAKKGYVDYTGKVPKTGLVETIVLSANDGEAENVQK
jgi:hypothetical protein